MIILDCVFLNWLNPIPDDVGEDDVTVGIEDYGLKDDAPPEAVAAYQKYIEDMARAEERGVWR